MRENWDTYFMNMATIAKRRSTCVREGRQIGAVLVKDKYILSTGYNGAPSGCEHCIDIGCMRDELNIPSGTQQQLCRAVHAEQNAILQCAIHGVSTKGATLYVTTQPCVICAKMIINAGIVKVIYQGDYPDELSLELLKEAGIKLVRIS